MTEDVVELLKRQRAAVAALKEEAADLAAAVADDAWDRFELEIESAVGDEFITDMAGSVEMMLRSALTMAFDGAFEKQVSQRFARLEEAVQAALGGVDGFDGATVDLAALRKGLKLGRHATQAIRGAVERAKPGLGRAIGSLLGEIFSEPEEQMDALEKDMRRDAQRLKAELLGLRNELTAQMHRDAELLVKQGARAYLDWLEEVEMRAGQAMGAAA